MNERQRIGSLQQALAVAGIDAALFQYSRSTLYYAGTTQPSILVVTPRDYRLIVLRGLEFVKDESRLDPTKIAPGKGYEDVETTLRKWNLNAGRVGMELDVTSAGSYLRLVERFSPFQLTDVSDLVLNQRARKDAGEVACIREACRIVDHGHRRALQVLREGMTELELSSEVEDAHREAGHEGLYFMRQLDFFMGRGPLASGENLSRIAGKVRSVTGVGLSPSIPMGASRRRIRRGDVIIVDIPTHYHGYHADQSRTYALGEAPPGCRTLYGGLKEVADRTIERMQPGVPCGEVFDAACSFADELGIGKSFKRLGDDPRQLPFVGHGIGLELNEPPLVSRNSDRMLQEGMVVALELEACGPAGDVVKLEDMIWIGPHGAEILTVSGRELHEVCPE